ncbi:hypothetical protein FD30_GL000838 [Levilactobacillus namurensis DSM 19117]|uniref:HTH marR-type domain-containing protein n=1 Tax=Levilactobacillus namurensis DSM 19117 TaxID=1423773 RepID=A0A0R1JNS2_9LACO|nr:MarR family transcriptional regulator [Levilactobacillus namurensis]KRK73094.1 hypothetical protein FD30_GL000838 [Levilactobacillus namurensis DSM 19117]GEO74698.1 hypothetical protein LNA02_13960 [Levilactobacillus namurensis]
MATPQFDLASCMMFITTRSSKLFSTKFNQALTPTGLAKSAWMALYYIQQQPRINQHDLAEMVGITGPSMVKIVGQLSQDALITITPSQRDKRERLLELTDTGRRRLTSSLPIADAFQDTVTQNIPQKDLDTVARVMAQMVKNAQNM